MPPASDPPPRRLAREIAPAVVSHLCLHASMAGSRMAAPLLALQAGHGEAAAGLLVGLFALMQVFVSLPAGRMADRDGLVKPLAWSVVASFVGIAAAVAWPVYPVLCLTALCCGGSHGATTIALQRHVGRAAQTPTELRQVFAWISIAPAIANMLGPLLAGAVIDLAGYRAAFAALGALPLLAWFIARNTQEYPREAASGRKLGAAWKLLANPMLRRLMLMNWFMSVSWDFHSFIIPLMGHERGLPASAIGLVLGAFTVAAGFVRLLLPLLAHSVREWALITGTMAVAGVLLLVYPFTTGAVGMILCSSALGMALGSVQPMVMSLLHQTTPPDRHGEALAVRIILVNLSAVVLPVAIGAAGGIVGAAGAFWLMGAMVTAGSRLGVALRHADVDTGGPHRAVHEKRQ